MAANGSVTLAWGDGDHTFNVAKIGQALVARIEHAKTVGGRNRAKRRDLHGEREVGPELV